MSEQNYKIKNKNIKHGVYVYDTILIDDRLNSNDKILLIFYMKMSIDKNYSYFSQNKITKLINISIATIKRSNKKLEKYNYIKINKAQNGVNIITINQIKNISIFEKISKLQIAQNELPPSSKRATNNKKRIINIKTLHEKAKQENDFNKDFREKQRSGQIESISDIIKLYPKGK